MNSNLKIIVHTSIGYRLLSLLQWEVKKLIFRYILTRCDPPCIISECFRRRPIKCSSLCLFLLYLTSHGWQRVCLTTSFITSHQYMNTHKREDTHNKNNKNTNNNKKRENEKKKESTHNLHSNSAKPKHSLWLFKLSCQKREAKIRCKHPMRQLISCLYAVCVHPHSWSISTRTHSLHNTLIRIRYWIGIVTPE